MGLFAGRTTSNPTGKKLGNDLEHIPYSIKRSKTK